MKTMFWNTPNHRSKSWLRQESFRPLSVVNLQIGYSWINWSQEDNSNVTGCPKQLHHLSGKRTFLLCRGAWSKTISGGKQIPQESKTASRTHKWAKFFFMTISNKKSRTNGPMKPFVAQELQGMTSNLIKRFSRNTVQGKSTSSNSASK